jgi:hypothetical protein
VDSEDCPTIEVPDISISTTGATTTVSAEVTVECCDGTEIGMSLEQDLGPMSLPIEEILAEFQELVESTGAELAGGCPEGIPVWVEDGEEGGLA